jgi:hypothetical protein
MRTVRTVDLQLSRKALYPTSYLRAALMKKVKIIKVFLELHRHFSFLEIRKQKIRSLMMLQKHSRCGLSVVGSPKKITSRFSQKTGSPC